MEDGPKLLPQWLRGSSSALHHRGDTFDASKRGKSANVTRPSTQADAWVPRVDSGVSLNSASSAVTAKPQSDFGRVADRGNLSDRSWKPRDNGFSAVSSRSGYVPAGLRHSVRDDRDVISLKPGGGYNNSRTYGRPGEPEGGAGGRLDRPQDNWQPARGPSTGSGVPNGVSRGDDDSLSPIRSNVLASGGAAGTAAVAPKVSYQADFPSLGSRATLSGAASAPLLSGTSSSSPLQDTATSAAALPYRQTFLSSRTSSNWTSKLAEAPSAPSPSISPSSGQQQGPAIAATDEDVLAPQAAAGTPSPSPSLPSAATALSPSPASAGAAGTVATVPAAPVPAVPPRPSGVWGTAATAAAVSATTDAGHAGIAAAIGPPSVNRARLDHIAVRQSKQLVPVISSGSGKSKSGGLGGGGGASGLSMAAGGQAVGVGAVVASGRATTGGGPKPVVPTAGLLKMSAGKRDDSAIGPGAAAAGARLLASNTVILSKKASQPLDRPLTLRAASVSSSVVAVAGEAVPAQNMAPASIANGTVSEGDALLGLSPATSLDAKAAGGLHSNDSTACTPAPPAVVHAVACATGLASCPASAPPPQSGRSPRGQAQPQLQVQQTLPKHEQRQGPQSLQPQQRASAAALQVSEEEEAFLRSLGWTGFDDDDGDGEDTGLTEEEIAAFRAEQQRQQAAVAASVGALAAEAAKPKAVPAAAVRRRGTPLIVAASYGSEQVSSSTDSDSECE